MKCFNTNSFDNLGEIDKFLEKYNFLKLSEVEILNSSIFIKNISFFYSKIFPKGNSRLIWSHWSILAKNVSVGKKPMNLAQTLPEYRQDSSFSNATFMRPV